MSYSTAQKELGDFIRQQKSYEDWHQCTKTLFADGIINDKKIELLTYLTKSVCIFLLSQQNKDVEIDYILTHFRLMKNIYTNL